MECAVPGSKPARQPPERQPGARPARGRAGLARVSKQARRTNECSENAAACHMLHALSTRTHQEDSPIRDSGATHARLSCFKMPCSPQAAASPASARSTVAGTQAAQQSSSTRLARLSSAGASSTADFMAAGIERGVLLCRVGNPPVWCRRQALPPPWRRGAGGPLAVLQGADCNCHACLGQQGAANLCAADALAVPATTRPVSHCCYVREQPRLAVMVLIDWLLPQALPPKRCCLQALPRCRCVVSQPTHPFVLPSSTAHHQPAT